MRGPRRMERFGDSHRIGSKWFRCGDRTLAMVAAAHCAPNGSGTLEGEALLKPTRPWGFSRSLARSGSDPWLNRAFGADGIEVGVENKGSIGIPTDRACRECGRIDTIDMPCHRYAITDMPPICPSPICHLFVVV